MINKIIKSIRVALLVLVLQLIYLTIIFVALNTEQDAEMKMFLIKVILGSVPILVFIISWVIFLKKENDINKEVIEEDIVKPRVEKEIGLQLQQINEENQSIKEKFYDFQKKIKNIEDDINDVFDKSDSIRLKNRIDQLEKQVNLSGTVVDRPEFADNEAKKSIKNENIQEEVLRKSRVIERIDVVGDKNNPDKVRKQNASEHFQVIKKSDNKYYLTVKDNVIKILDPNDYHAMSELRKFFKVSVFRGGKLKVNKEPEVEQWNGRTGLVNGKGSIG